MSKAIERRIAKLEGPPVLPTIFLYANADDFDTRLAEAKATGARVIVTDDNTPPRIEDGVEYMDSLNAAFTQLAAQPSKTGRGNAVDDLLQSLGGNVIGVAACATIQESRGYDDEAHSSDEGLPLANKLGKDRT